MVAADTTLPDAVVLAETRLEDEIPNCISPFEHIVPGATGRHTMCPSTQNPNWVPSEEQNRTKLLAEQALPGETTPEATAPEAEALDMLALDAEAPVTCLSSC